MRVEVRPYDDGWPAAFEAIERGLAAALEGVPLVGIEHVGSTSVPGLAAKPVIDVDIVVAGADEVAAATERLTSSGYIPLGDLGVAERYAFTAPPGEPRRNVYLTIDGCLSLRNHLAVRDLLREDSDLRDRYGRLKLRLTHNDYDDVGQYVADRSELIQEILARGGLTAAERASIAEANRS